MLPLDDPSWSELRHAFGDARDAPDFIRLIEADPGLHACKMDDASDPMNNFIFNTVIHQGTLYSATFAIIPHIVRIVAASPAAAHPALVDVTPS